MYVIERFFDGAWQPFDVAMSQPAAYAALHAAAADFHDEIFRALPYGPVEVLSDDERVLYPKRPSLPIPPPVIMPA